MKRKYKKLSTEERVEHERKVAQIEAERPEIDTWARQGFERDVKMHEVLTALKAARVRKGLSLADVDELTQIGKGNLSRLENHPDANPTLDTLFHLAQALGVELRVNVVDAQTSGRKQQEAA